MKKHILIVEDEKNISDVIAAYLHKNNFKTTQVYDGLSALSEIDKNSFNLIILDLMLPKLSGEDVALKIRKTSNIPIIMLTAKIHEDDLLRGFDLGADDYITKPFSPRELVKRVEAVLKRTEKTLNKNIININNNELLINFQEMNLLKNNKKISLTSNEFKILEIFIKNINQVLSREQIIESAFGYDYDGYDRTIDAHIKNLRQKIEDSSKNNKYIQTVYGAGYKFVGEIS